MMQKLFNIGKTNPYANFVVERKSKMKEKSIDNIAEFCQPTRIFAFFSLVPDYIFRFLHVSSLLK
jgi:ABC-type metal ion transport system substrate-binding protein